MWNIFKVIKKNCYSDFVAEENSEAESQKTITIRLPGIPKVSPWMVTTALLLVVCLVLVVQPQIIGNLPTGRVASVGGLTAQQAGEKVVDYINDNLVQGGGATFVSSEEFSNDMYKVVTEYQDNEIGVYITKDGKLLFTSDPFDTTQPRTTTTTTQPQELNIEEEDLKEFIGCLKDSDFKIYGANWCGYTTQLVAMLGGFDMVEPIYIECTEQKEECDNAGVTGYPTIIIGGEGYRGDRTFKAFSDVTGCAIPAGAEMEQSNPSSSDPPGC